MGILNVQNLSHSFGEKELYQAAGFELFKGEHMGVVGQNGTGKSTLIQILLGNITPSGGEINWQRNLSIGHIDQYADLNDGYTIESYLKTAFSHLYEAEESMLALYAQMDEETPQKLLNKAALYQETLLKEGFYEIDTKVLRIAQGLGLAAIGMQREINTLSGGQRTKLILAKLLLSQPDVLLLDEPTNFLDAEHIQWLSGYLREFKGSFIVVSHDFHFLDSITSCILDIEFQTMHKYNGRYLDFVKQKKQRRADYVHMFQAQQQKVKRLEEYIAKNRVRTATARQAQSRIKMLERIDRLPPPSVLPKPNIAFKPLPLQVSYALEVSNLLVGYDHPLLPPLEFIIRGGQKAVITGFNGIGKSTLLKTLVGALPSLGGSFAFADPVQYRYFEQDLHWPYGELTPLQILSAQFPDLLPKQLRRELARCGVSGKHALQPIQSLSGGEQNKVKLCAVTLTPGNFLILDEPTNHLDAETKESLKEAIAAFPGCVLLVCHEKAFYEDFVDIVIDIEKLI